MPKEIQFKEIIPSKDSLYYKKEMIVNEKKVITPVKTIDVSKLKNEFQINDKSKTFYEIYKRVTEESLKNIISNTDRFEYSLNTLMNKIGDKFRITFIEFDGKWYPTKKNLEFLLDITYEYSDMTTIPLIKGLRSKLISEKEFSKFKKFLIESLDIINTLNFKPIIGLIPFDRTFDNELIKFYRKHDIECFAIDFDGKNPRSHKATIRSIMRNLKQNELLGNSVIYGINIKPGIFNKGKDVIEAKDIISFGYGIDILGESHVIPKRKKEVWDKIKISKDSRYRIFIKNDYGYYKVKSDKIRKNYPKDTEIKFENLLKFENNPEKRTLIQKLINMEQKGLECINLREKIENEKIEDYISKKKNVNKISIKDMRGIKKEVFHQTILTKY